LVKAPYLQSIFRRKNKMPEKKLQLVIIEDDEDDFESFIRVLKDCQISYEMTWLKDGGEGICFLEDLENSGPSNPSKRIFFLDVNLPKISGFELLKAIKDHPITKKDYVFMLTGSKNQRERETAENNGSDYYFQKPFSDQEITIFTSLLCSKLSSIAQSNIE